MANRPSLDDYVDVAERLQDFMDAHPNGSLQTISWEVCEIGSAKFVVYRAAAYREPEDPRPGHGIAWEPFPGTTPYTKNSELMNAETAAWGRAIVALGLAANRKLASRQEVRARVEEQDATPEPAPKRTRKPKADKPAPAPAAAEERTPPAEAVAKLLALYERSGWEDAIVRMQLAAVGAANEGEVADCFAALTRQQFETVWTALEADAK